jgi:hypothetical protein
MTDFTGPTIPDNIPLHTPVKDELERRLHLGGEVPIDLGRETTFDPAAHVSVNLSVGNLYWGENDEQTKGVLYVEILVHGRMTFKDRADSGACVSVRYTPNGVHHWCKSTAWHRNAFVEMPEGARKRVSDKVRELLGDIDWQALSAETQVSDRTRSINQQLSEARGLLESARREMQVRSAPVKNLHKGVVAGV